MHRVLADLSRLANRLTGGPAGKTLCNRVARVYGYDCVFCRLVAFVLSDRDHCLDELSAAEIVALKKRK